MLIPAMMIERQFSIPDYQPNHSRAIAAVCLLCKSVDTYFLDRIHPRHNALYLRVFAVPIRDTMDGPMLGCSEEGCEALVPLFAQWNPDATGRERKAEFETWQWGHLQCPHGHFITKPDWELS
jgi:hypothetical protein